MLHIPKSFMQAAWKKNQSSSLHFHAPTHSLHTCMHAYNQSDKLLLKRCSILAMAEFDWFELFRSRAQTDITKQKITENRNNLDWIKCRRVRIRIRQSSHSRSTNMVNKKDHSNWFHFVSIQLIRNKMLPIKRRIGLIYRWRNDSITAVFDSLLSFCLSVSLSLRWPCNTK